MAGARGFSEGAKIGAIDLATGIWHNIPLVVEFIGHTPGSKSSLAIDLFGVVKGMDAALRTAYDKAKEFVQSTHTPEEWGRLQGQVSIAILAAVAGPAEFNKLSAIDDAASKVAAEYLANARDIVQGFKKLETMAPELLEGMPLKGVEATRLAAAAANSDAVAMDMAKGLFSEAKIRASEVADVLESTGKYWAQSFKLTGIESAAEANAEFAEPAYLADTQVITYTTIADESWVRVYCIDNPIGRWMMRESDITGLSAQEIAVKFNLPTVPTMVQSVKIPAGAEMKIGIVGPNSFGSSEGAIQFRLTSRLDTSWYTKIGDIK